MCDRMQASHITPLLRGLAAASLLAFAGPATAKEVPIGPHVTQNGLEVAAVYLQPIEMDPPGMMREAAKSDIHLETDIRAAKDNRNASPRGTGCRPSTSGSRR